VELITRDAQPAPGATPGASKRGQGSQRPPGSGPPTGQRRDKGGF
jgi:hypothetical protein